MDLALRVVEAAGARPAIGAAEHRARAVVLAHAAEFGAEQVERRVPGHRHELVAAAAIVRTRSVLQPAAADHRLRDARPMSQGAGEILDDAVWIGIAGYGRTSSSPSFIRAENTPQCEVCGMKGGSGSCPGRTRWIRAWDCPPYLSARSALLGQIMRGFQC